MCRVSSDQFDRHESEGGDHGSAENEGHPLARINGRVRVVMSSAVRMDVHLLNSTRTADIGTTFRW